jgi:rhomboid protease GluP
LGSLYFTLIYFSGLIAGALVSYVTHPGAYLSVGASGAISAILGALLCLRILGKIGLDWNFFAINIGLNVVLAASASRIDWQAHLGGFVGGMVCCAGLDLLEKALPWMLRCRFPEFVKMNAFIVLAIVTAYLWTSPIVGHAHQDTWVLAMGSALAILVVIKLLDLVLSVKKGLAVIVVAFALTNALLFLLLRGELTATLASLCLKPPGGNALAAVAEKACANLDATIGVAAASAFAVTMLVCWPPFARGIADVGFVGATFRGERNRRRGV